MLKIAFSPCPNDTTLFYPWVNGTLGKELPIDPTLADIQRLNEMAKTGAYDLIKVSFACLGEILDQYDLFPCGAALGYHCGPKIIATLPLSFDEIAGKRIAIPGKNTTAHLLFDLFTSQIPSEKIFCPYNKILPLLKEGCADCGVIIHESRFTFKAEGFYEIADFGTLWHNKIDLPLPLGCLAVSKTLTEKTRNHISSILRECYLLISKNPQFSRDYVLTHSQEKDPEVIQQHIKLYVTE